MYIYMVGGRRTPPVQGGGGIRTSGYVALHPLPRSLYDGTLLLSSAFPSPSPHLPLWFYSNSVSSSFQPPPPLPPCGLFRGSIALLFT